MIRFYDSFTILWHKKHLQLTLAQPEVTTAPAGFDLAPGYKFWTSAPAGAAGPSGPRQTLENTIRKRALSASKTLEIINSKNVPKEPLFLIKSYWRLNFFKNLVNNLDTQTTVQNENNNSQNTRLTPRRWQNCLLEKRRKRHSNCWLQRRSYENRCRTPNLLITHISPFAVQQKLCA